LATHYIVFIFRLAVESIKDLRGASFLEEVIEEVSKDDPFVDTTKRSCSLEYMDEMK
jgi:hypothetical protein